LLFSFALEYAIRNIQKNHGELKLNGTHQLLFYADGENINTLKKNIQTLIDSSKEVGLEINTKKTKCMLLSHQQNAVQHHDIKIGSRYFENVVQFRYFE
jgi:hypothetical protein